MIFEKKIQTMVIIIVYIWFPFNSELNAMVKHESYSKTPISIVQMREDKEKWQPENFEEVKRVLCHLHAKKRMRRFDSEQQFESAAENAMPKSFSFNDFLSLEPEKLEIIRSKSKDERVKVVVVAITGSYKSDTDSGAGSAYE